MIIHQDLGGRPSHFLVVFGILAPGGAQEGSRGSPGVPRGAQSHPKYQLLMFFGRFGVDFNVSLLLLGVQGVPEPPK